MYLMTAMRSASPLNRVAWTHTAPDPTGAQYSGGAVNLDLATLVSRSVYVDPATPTRSSLGVQDGPRVLPLCTYVTNDGPLAAAGLLRFDPAAYAVTGRTLTVTLEAVANVSADGPTGSVVLYDLTADAQAASLSFTETVATAKTASVTVPGSTRLYELRASLTGGDGYLTLSAALRLTWS